MRLLATAVASVGHTLSPSDADAKEDNEEKEDTMSFLYVKWSENPSPSPYLFGNLTYFPFLVTRN